MILGALATMRKANVTFDMSVRPFVSPQHGTAWLPLDGFS
jgi:hypothetical protein